MVKQAKKNGKKQAERRSPKKVAQGRPKGGPTSKGSPAAIYREALRNPFANGIGGVRVPDLYAVPTIARTITRTFQLHSSAAGTLDAFMLPHPSIPIYSTRGNIAGGATWTLAKNTTKTVASGCATNIDAPLEKEFASYRVVSWGAKITSMASFNDAKGYVHLGTVPYSGIIPLNAGIGGQTDTAVSTATFENYLTDSGIPATGELIDIGQLPNMTKATTASTAALQNSTVVAVSKISSPQAFNFRRSKDSFFGYDIHDQTSATYVASGDASYMDASGWEALVLGATGLPVSAPMFTVTIVFHLEGVPRLSTSSINSDSGSRSPSDWQGFMNAVSAAANHPTFIALGQAGLNALQTSLTGMLL
jgi:hypothetical protein